MWIYGAFDPINIQNTAKQNYPGSVASYNTRPGNEVGLFYNAPEPKRMRTRHYALHTQTAQRQRTFIQRLRGLAGREATCQPRELRLLNHIINQSPRAVSAH